MKTYEEIQAGSSISDIMEGVTFNKVEKIVIDGDEQLVFSTDAGYKVIFYHDQDCCERVYIEDICGDLNDLVGEPLIVARSSCNRVHHEEEENGSITWTFYTFRTVKGTVDVRWFGTSNGYYSEHVNVMVSIPELATPIPYMF